MSFSELDLHPDLLRGIKELGFARPTPIQAQAIPAAMAGKDLLACAMTGSGKTAAFLLPIVHRLIDKPRRTTRALVITPTRELAAQILENLNELATHTPVTGAAIYGGVGMGPQEHAFRSGVDVIVATPGRLLDHLRFPYAKLDKVEHLVLDEADRMLDMGFLPEIRKILRFVPQKRQTLFFSATMPTEIAKLSKEMLHEPVMFNVERVSTPAVGITQAIYPVARELKGPLFMELLKRGEIQDALVFTRTKHRANRLWEVLTKHGFKVARIHANRSQPQRAEALAGFKDGRYRVLVATDIAARGIDVTALGHVVNFDVPAAPEDYIHRVGRTARAEQTGHAFTFVAPDEEDELRRIERAVGKRLPRVTLPDFDYNAPPEQPHEIPLQQRIAEIRKRKADDRARAKAKADRRAAHAAGQGGAPGGHRPGSKEGPGSGPRSQGGRPGGPRRRGPGGHRRGPGGPSGGHSGGPRS